MLKVLVVIVKVMARSRNVLCCLQFLLLWDWHATISACISIQLVFMILRNFCNTHTHTDTLSSALTSLSLPSLHSKGVEKTHICSVAAEWRECPVRAVISWEGLLPVQLCLTGTTTLVNELFTEDTCTYTHMHSREHRWHRYFFPWCVVTVAVHAFFYKGRNQQCYHVREEKHPEG